MISFLTENWIEITGALLAVIYLFLSIRGNIWLWVLGFLTSSFYLMIFFKSRLYADMGLQFYYIIVSIYGWFHWLGKQKVDKTPVTNIKTRSLSTTSWFVSLLVVLILMFIIYWILLYGPSFFDLPASDLPLGDAFTTAASIVATWMLARKILENWLYWIVIDTVSLGMYIYKGLYITSLLFLIYSIMAVIGYLQWKKAMRVHGD